MRHLLKISLFLFLSLYTYLSARADGPPLPHDRSIVKVRQPSADKLKAYRSNSEYQYGQEIKPVVSFWGELWAKIIRWLDDFFSNKSYGTTRQILAYLFIAATLVFVVLKMIGVDLVGLFTRKTAALDIPYDVLSENIHGIDFQQAIEQALNDRSYRLAVRLYYLKALKELSDKNLITWQLNKTNRRYSYELSEGLRPIFDDLTTQFEYVWYGDFPVNEGYFRQIRQGFDSFTEQIK